MRILHVCLAAFYIDNYAYQENILPRMHKMQGHVVQILASTETYIGNQKIGYLKPSRYVNEDGIHVHRIPYATFLPHKIMTKLRCYPGIYEELVDFQPDIIFLHDIQFVSTKQILRFAKQNPIVRIIADGHSDYVNSARGIISRWILHGIIYRSLAQALLPYTEIFYGTLPSRVKFFEEVYHIPKEKIDFLPMGADDKMVFKVQNDGSRQQIRKYYGFTDSDLILVSGGKINSQKREFLNLMDAVNDLNGIVKLIFFGSVSDDLKEEFNSKIRDSNILMLGWVNEEKSYQYLNAGDVAIFPCLHSTLWEQAAGLGLPCILHKMDGFTHIDLDNNCILVEHCGIQQLKDAIQICINDFHDLRVGAERCAIYFSYRNIARRAIQDKISIIKR